MLFWIGLFFKIKNLFYNISQARLHSLSETLMIQLSSVCTPPFFVENVPEVQMQAIKLFPIIFAKCPALREAMLVDLLNMVHKLPMTRNIRNSYRLSANESIGNFTVLILQLVQSTVQVFIYVYFIYFLLSYLHAKLFSIKIIARKKYYVILVIRMI